MKTLSIKKITVIILFFIELSTVLGAVNSTFYYNKTPNPIDTNLVEEKGPVFSTIISNNYNLNVKRFILIPENQKYKFNITTKKSYFETYYYGNPFLSGMNNFVYVNYAEKIAKIPENEFVTYDANNYPKNQIIELPYSILYFLNDYKITDDNKILIENIYSKQLQKILKPFYFSKYEVSIAEYKEFANWVLKTNKQNNSPYILEEIIIDNQKTTIKKLKWNTNKNITYNYKFYNINIEKEIGTNTICIAPLDSIEAAYKNKHSVNPFYYANNINDNLPIMGISYYQALAFLDWKQHFHQKYLDTQNSNLEILYEIPNSIEYEMATQKMVNLENWLCDLQFTKNYNNLKNILQFDVLHNNLDTINKAFFENNISDVNISNKNLTENEEKKYETRKKHSLQLSGIEWLDGNVSEWTSDSYSENWETQFNKYKNSLANTPENNLVISLLNYYNNTNAKNGKLVVGSNYIDYRESIIYTNSSQPSNTINKAGIYTKKYVDPNLQYSTIGFRYVVKVKVKQEAQKDSLLRNFGTIAYNNYDDFPLDFNKYFVLYTNKNKVNKPDTNINVGFKLEIIEDKLVSKNEITNGMWRKFLLDLYQNGQKEKALQYIPNDSLWAKYNDNYLYYFKEIKYDNLPVVNISKEMSDYFNEWLTAKFNHSASYSKFKLPSNNDWQQYARSSNKTSYTWNIGKNKDLKVLNYSNINSDLYAEIETFINENLYKYTTSDILYIKFADLPQKLSLEIYNSQISKKSKYDKFLNEGFVYHKYPYLTEKTEKSCDSIPELVNIIGNVSEMLDSAQITKGGSWNTNFRNAKIENSENWNEMPSPLVGFRPIMISPQKVDSAELAKLMDRIPPGTILLNKNFGVDILEMRNIDYLSFLNNIANIYGKQSKQYKNAVPNPNVWKGYIFDGIDLEKEYFKNSTFYNNPLVGVTYNQALMYCDWRSEYINRLYEVYHIKYDKSIGVPKKVTYRLPLPQEWDKIALTDSIYIPDEGMVKPDFKNITNTANTHINKGLTSSVFYYWKNKIGLYAFDDNVSEMTSEEGVSRGCNWTGGKENANCSYEEAENWIGFRCVVDVEY